METTLTYKDYRITIARDDSPENPFEDWDGEPPLLTYYGGRHGEAKAYGNAPENIREVLHLLPADTWERGKRIDFINQFLRPHYSMREIAQTVKEYGSLFDAADELLSSQFNNNPSGWREAVEWFDMAEAVLNFAGIPCKADQSTGYSQGDVTLCLVVLTPDWCKVVGFDAGNAEACKAACDSAIELYSAWAWGDVYGVASIETTEGEELEDASCWGFYGSDHEVSGLMEHARGEIDAHIHERGIEREALEYALFCNA